MKDVWNYRDRKWREEGDLVGCEVVAADGAKVGKVVAAPDHDGHDRIIVDTGHWIFGKKRAIPAGTIVAVDHDARVVRVNMTKDDIEGGPEHHDRRWSEDVYRREHEQYYEDHVRVV